MTPNTETLPRTKSVNEKEKIVKQGDGKVAEHSSGVKRRDKT